MLSSLSRFLPVLFAVMIFIMLFQFLEDHWPQTPLVPAAVGWLRGALWYIAAGVLVGWTLLALGYLYDREHLPRGVQRRTLLGVLDWLTARTVPEELPGGRTEPVLLNAGSLARALKQRVIGQSAVCDDIAAQIRRRLALALRGRPVGIFLFAGPPGTGKTYLAKVLSRELERPLLHFDMTQFAAGSHAVAQLFGMARGYAGSDTYGMLTASLIENPGAVVLLDEIEKAHPDILKAFLTAWNDGFVTERSDGKLVSTASAIFVLTTNAATEQLTELARRHDADNDALRAAAVNALHAAAFAPEVLNRLDRIFIFRPLQGLDVARVIALEIEDMIRGYDLEIATRGIDPEIIMQLMDRYQRFGKAKSARDIARAIEEQLADSLIEARKRGIKRVELAIMEGQRVVARGLVPPAGGA